MTAVATAALATATAPEPQPTAEDDLLAALARTARQPLAPSDEIVVQAMAAVLWRKGARR